MGPTLIGSTPKSIVTQTAQGNNIPNEQILEISDLELKNFAGLEKQYAESSQRRSGATGRYNCHGMTFGSRRTGIFEESVVNQILKVNRPGFVGDSVN